MSSRFLSVHVFIAYVAAMIFSSFFSYGATFPLFSWQLFNHVEEHTKFFEVRVTTDSRSCLLAHCFEKPGDRAVAWGLLSNIGLPSEDSCKSTADITPAQLQLLKNQVLAIFQGENVQRVEMVAIENSFIDYMTKRIPDENLVEKNCYSF